MAACVLPVREQEVGRAKKSDMGPYVVWPHYPSVKVIGHADNKKGGTRRCLPKNAQKSVRLFKFLIFVSRDIETIDMSLTSLS